MRRFECFPQNVAYDTSGGFQYKPVWLICDLDQLHLHIFVCSMRGMGLGWEWGCALWGRGEMDKIYEDGREWS